MTKKRGRDDGSAVEDMKMKNSLLLAVACFCALAVGFPTAAGELRNGAETAADRVSWSDLMAGNWFGPAYRAKKDRIEVIEIGLDPTAADVPGAIAAVLPEYEAVLKTVRDVVARNQVLSSSLKDQGFDVDDVLGFSRGADGAVSVFVRSSA